MKGENKAFDHHQIILSYHLEVKVEKVFILPFEVVEHLFRLVLKLAPHYSQSYLTPCPEIITINQFEIELN